jgi:hypothetical protein
MRKILIFITVLFLAIAIMQTTIYAASIPLNSITVNISKDKIEPGEEVKVDINFGTELGAYTFDIAYDNSIFEYVKSEGGTENDNGTRVRVTYYDSTGGTNPRTNMYVVFKAKEDITSTNPTNFSITAEGLANSDASQEYDDITQAIEKQLTVEPNYKQYNIDLEYTEKLIKDKDIDLKLVTKSSMGKNYDNLMTKAEIISKPQNANIKLTAMEDNSNEINMIETGYGSTKGFSLGGKNAHHEINMKANFDTTGEYKIKFSILDKDSSNAVVVEKEFTLNVIEENTNVSDTENNADNEDNSENNNPNNSNDNQNSNINNEEELPKELPKTGMTQYVYIIAIISLLLSGYIVNKNLKKDK